MTETLPKETTTPLTKNIPSKQNTSNSLPKINPELKRFPYCIVWTPLPLITSLLPCIGHTGICSSTGITHDFSGPYYVGVDNLSFGETHKYIQLSPNETEKQKWDEAIKLGDIKYNKEEHNFIFNNCHSHCAYVLNQMNYKGRSNYTMIDIFLMVSINSKYISYRHVIKTYFISIIILCIIVYVMYYVPHI